MTDHYAHPIEARDLSSRLTSLQNQISTENGGRPSADRVPTQRPRAASSSSSHLSHLPKFSKSSTMSTTCTADSLRVSHAYPLSHTSCASAEVRAGDFSKPRINRRSRRGTHGSSRSEGDKEMEFKYYGRHGNQWLFNDFSVTDAVAKGFKKVFRKDDGEKGDWYENRK